MKKIHVKQIGYVERLSVDENDKDRSLESKIIINKNLTNSLDGITDFSHIYVIFWMDRVRNTNYLHHPSKNQEFESVGIFATRAPIHPNPIGLTLVELVNHDRNVLWVRGLDAYDKTPVLDIKPYPDWEHGECIIIDDYRVPKWLMKK
jgi:tRNA-Thr(GGU) m(6)t(6)A37 methyltransferase TsaA